MSDKTRKTLLEEGTRAWNSLHRLSGSNPEVLEAAREQVTKGVKPPSHGIG